MSTTTLKDLLTQDDVTLTTYPDGQQVLFEFATTSDHYSRSIPLDGLCFLILLHTTDLDQLDYDEILELQRIFPETKAYFN